MKALGQWEGGKGSKPRPVNSTKWGDNWDAIFAKKTTKEKKQLDERVSMRETDISGGSDPV